MNTVTNNVILCFAEHSASSAQASPVLVRRRRATSNESGIALIATILVMLLLSLVGTSLLVSGMSDLGTSANYRSSKAAFYEADSGLEQTMIDFVADSTWTDDAVNKTTLPLTLEATFPTTITINGHTITLTVSNGAVVPDYYPLGTTVPFGSGTFARELFLPPTSLEPANAKGSQAWLVMPIRSTGTAGGAEPSTQVLAAEARARVMRLSVWDNAIFAGIGQAGNTVNGNVQVRGSIHVVGDPINPTTIAWNGDAMLLNNYVGANDNQNFGLDALKLPPLPTRLIDGDLMESLDAEFRVKYGGIDVGGNVKLGEPEQPGDGHKETLDGLWADSVSYSGNAASYYDDSGPYDITVDVPFPSLDDPFFDANSGITYLTHRAYLDAVSMTIPVAEISDNTPAFSYSDVNGNFAQWDPATGQFEIDGIVRISGSLEVGRSGGPPAVKRIEYTGTGTLYATDDIAIHWDVVPTGDYLDINGPDSYNLGLIADDDIEIATGGGDSWIKLFAAIYGEDQITVAKQTRVAGALVGNHYDLGTNVPRIFQVPRLAAMLPPGMPGSEPMLYVSRADLRNWAHLR